MALGAFLAAFTASNIGAIVRNHSREANGLLAAAVGARLDEKETRLDRVPLLHVSRPTHAGLAVGSLVYAEAALTWFKAAATSLTSGTTGIS